jgi:hypothetical protein
MFKQRKRRTGLPQQLAVMTLSSTLVVFSGIASAVNPATETTGTGQTLTISIDDPADGDVFPVGELITVSGTAGITELSANSNVLYVIDVSGSTGGDPGQDCNFDGTPGTDEDNFNTDTRNGNILDCEISGIIELNQDLVGIPGVEGGIIAFASGARSLDVDPFTDGNQTFTALDADTNNNSVLDLEEAARTLRSSGGTSFNNALTEINEAFDDPQRTGDENVVFFLSDGRSSLSTGPGTPLGNAVIAGTQINTYAIGPDSDCSNSSGNPSSLGIIAQETGGTCTKVEEADDLNAALTGGTSGIGIDQVEVSLNGGPPVEANFDSSTGNWSVDLLDPLVLGSNLIEATVFADDGTQATADITVTTLDDINTETDPPECKLIAIDEGPPATLTVKTQDTGSGLDQINILIADNATVDIPPFTIGTTEEIIVKAEKIDQSRSSQLQLEVIDVAGNVTECDPIDTIVEANAPGQLFTNVPGIERQVFVYNGDPGLEQLIIEVNGQEFLLEDMEDAYEYYLDIESALVPGNNNTIVLMGIGEPGDSAEVLIRD